MFWIYGRVQGNDFKLKSATIFRQRVEKRLKEMNIFVNLKKSVDHGANGTQEYVIKKGVNKGKVAK